MATSVEGVVFQANFKTHAGTLLNIYATNGAEFGELLDAYADFIPKIAAVESALGAASQVAQVVPLAPAASQPQQAPQQQSPQPQGGPTCNCGNPAKLIPAGVSRANGRPYRAFYACAGPRGQQCDFRATA